MILFLLEIKNYGFVFVDNCPVKTVYYLTYYTVYLKVESGAKLFQHCLVKWRGKKEEKKQSRHNGGYSLRHNHSVVCVLEVCFQYEKQFELLLSTLTRSVFTYPGGEEGSLLGGGRSGRPRPLQAGGGRVGAGAAEQTEGRRRFTRAQLRLLKPLHAGRVLAR